MKKILLIFALFVSCIFVPIDFSDNKPDVYIDYSNSWTNNCSNCSFKSVTLRVVNKKYANIFVRVTCEYENGAFFGYRDVKIDMRNDLVFKVYGLSRSDYDDGIFCKITQIW